MIKKILLMAALLLGTSTAQAQIITTTPQLIQQVQVQAVGGFFVTPATGSWGSSDPACANAIYVNVIPSTSPEWKAMLATAMSAQVSERNIMFWGKCSATDPLYFEADQIILQ